MSVTEPAVSAAHGGLIQPQWSEVLCPPEPLTEELEMQWLDAALQGQATAALWTGAPGLVAPVSYRRYATFDSACAASAARGWPVRLRRSGGGVVPQGQGILNLTLAYPSDGSPGAAAHAVYAHLCQLLRSALARLGIAAQARSVQGSFCDGRFNLAVIHQGVVKKIAGTAQYWRRAAGHQAVLAHALLLVVTDSACLSAQANWFEADLASGRQYEASALTSVAEGWRQSHPDCSPIDLMATVRQTLADVLNQAALTPSNNDHPDFNLPGAQHGSA